MTVSCGQPMDALTFNEAFISRNTYASDADYQEAMTGKGLAFPDGTHLYFNSTDKKFRYHDGTAWKEVGGVKSVESVGDGVPVLSSFLNQIVKLKTIEATSPSGDIEVISESDKVRIKQKGRGILGNFSGEALAQTEAETREGKSLGTTEAGLYAYYDTSESELKYWNGLTWEALQDKGSDTLSIGNSWRVKISGNDLSFEKNNNGTWEEKFSIEG